ncbi:MAG TPA: type VI secretion system protein TssA [Stellaceae bacterium]|nr:type VI secretion system protein TssA [Stellaceae bacterium]
MTAAARTQEAPPPPGIDLAAILAPLPGDSPTGASLRFSGAYERIREARREDDASLPRGVWQTELKRANWGEVVRLAGEALATRSKDLQIACWLLEGLIHRQGFAGIAPGLGVIIGLCRAFWPHLHPAIEENDLSYRIAPFEWVNAHLPQTIYCLPLTRAGIVTPDEYAWEHYANALRLEQIRKANPTAKLDAGVKLAEFDAAAAATPTAFYRGVLRHIETSLALLGELDRLLDQACGKDAPSLAALRGALANIEGLVQTILRNRGEVAMTAEPMRPVPAAPAPTEELTEPAPPPFEGVIRDRDEAYRLILEVAEYLSRTEPHSPTPYLLRRAHSWGMMPLHELLAEMTRGRNDLAALFELLGLNPR